jgi:signal transduction histidine kinase
LRLTGREFLANAAHELRTPLTVIRATASQALQKERTPDEYVRALAEIRIAAERAGMAVSELLSWPEGAQGDLGDPAGQLIDIERFDLYALSERRHLG